jgi:hypothetical protein
LPRLELGSGELAKVRARVRLELGLGELAKVRVRIRATFAFCRHPSFHIEATKE